MEKNDCPIHTTLKYIGKKWNLLIIRDMFYGKKRFSDFLHANKGLTGKILSERLKELEKHSLIEKRIVSTSPVEIEYRLTKKGEHLNKVLYEIALFSMHDLKEEMKPGTCSMQTRKELASMLKIEA